MPARRRRSITAEDLRAIAAPISKPYPARAIALGLARALLAAWLVWTCARVFLER
jgi:hypothetical protein